MVPPGSHRVPRVRWYSGSCRLPSSFRLRDFHSLRSAFPGRLAKIPVALWQSCYPRIAPGLGSFPFARRYLGNRVFFLLLRVLRCFSSPGLPRCTYFIQYRVAGFIFPAGFPHSDISGSTSACDLPKLFAACRVLLRLLAPRHPPCALFILHLLLGGLSSLLLFFFGSLCCLG